MESSVSFLTDYRALDLTDLKGQFCGRVLADLGMEVVKVEPPGGDRVRKMPPFIDGPSGSKLSVPFAHLNAGKKSVVLDLQTAQGRTEFLQLAEGADVILESFPCGHLDAIGLGYHDLAQRNPRLIMASITGFGQTGPHRDYVCADIVAYAMSGLMYISGDPELPPCKPPETQAYYFGSLFAALGVVAALYYRGRTCAGNYIDVSMQETLATQEHLIRLIANDGVILKRAGSQHAQVAPAAIFPCRNGFVYLYVTQAHWKKLLEVWQDHPGELDGAEWLDNLFRRARADEINRMLMGFTQRYSKEELTELLQSSGIPCTPVNRPADFIVDSQVEARRFFVPVDYPNLGVVHHVAPPFLVNGERPPVHPAPAVREERNEPTVASDKAGEPRADGLAIDPAAAKGPLSGMRVLSFDKVLAGPYGMTLLAELGAEVIKVESDRGGLDPFRFFGSSRDPNLSPRFLEFNRNKKSITVNLKHPEGPRLITELVRRCDAVMDNFSFHVMPSVGLGYEELIKVKPDIVCLRMPGLGCTGPKRSYVTVGPNITSYTGFNYLWNHPETDPPVGSQTVFPDYVSGVFSAILITAAVLYRDRAGRGASIDLSQAEAAAYMIGISLSESYLSGRDIEPVGNDWPYSTPHGCYPCKGEDRWCVIAVETDVQWRALAVTIGRPELAEDGRFSTFEARRQNRAELEALLSSWTRDQDCHDVMRKLQRAGVPSGAVQNGADLAHDEHLKARGFLIEQQNPRLGRVILPGFPMRFSACPTDPNWEFPVLGHHNEAVFSDLLGYSSEKIAELKNDGVIA